MRVLDGLGNTAVRVTKSGLESDVQVDKAVHVYPIEHYAAWRTALGPGVLERFGYGPFGENLTIEGLLEAALATFELPKDQRDYLVSTQGT